MKIIRNLQEITSPIPGAVVTIGNFDGVHLGHREIFRRVVRQARATGGTSVVFTFVPHPLKLLDPTRAPRLINTYAEKERLIAASCIDVLICAPFTAEMASLTAETFVSRVLVGKIGVRHLVIGHDYAFGRGRKGDIGFLRRQGETLGFAVEVLGPVAQGAEACSSTRIRELIAGGEVAAVVEPLGRHFSLEGTVMHGAGRGEKLGFPTANLQSDKELLPRPGVYAVKARHGDRMIDGVANIGCNPTFGAGELTIEVHLLDFHQELYGEKLRLYFIERLREEICFSNPAELVQAIAEDVRRSREILAAARVIQYREYLDCGPLI